MNLFFLFTCVLSILLISSLIIPANAQSDHPNLIVSTEHVNDSIVNKFDMQIEDNWYEATIPTSFQIMEIIIDDPEISDITILQPEPTVRIDGQKVRMVQSTDGKWYGYVANLHDVKWADSTVSVAGTGFDFGEFCASTTNEMVLGVDFGETEGVAIARPFVGTYPSTNGDVDFQPCSDGNISSGIMINNVIRNAPPLTLSESIPLGQIGISPNIFPVIQLFNSMYDITYEKNGEVQVVYGEQANESSVSLSHSSYSDAVEIAGTDFELIFKQPQLNIDPTSKDIWTFLIASETNSKIAYRLFDQNGNFVDDGNNPYLMAGNERQLTINSIMKLHYEYNQNYYNPLPSPFQAKSNGFQTLDSDGGVTSIPSTYDFITVIETDKNSSIFTTIDENGNSSVSLKYRSDNNNSICELCMYNFKGNIGGHTEFNVLPTPPTFLTETVTITEDTLLQLPLVFDRETSFGYYNVHVTKDPHANEIFLSNTIFPDDILTVGSGWYGWYKDSNEGLVEREWYEVKNIANFRNSGEDLSNTNLIYLPESNFVGTSEISLYISAHTGGSYNHNPLYLQGKTSTIFVEIIPVNDAPITQHLTKVGDEDIPINIVLLANDVDGDTITFEVISNPTHGTLSGNMPNLTYTPDAHYFGNDEFTFNTNDGELNGNVESVVITINPVADIPTANANSDQSVDVDSIISLDGTQSYDNDPSDILTYSWIQTAGDPVTLTDSTNITPQFTAPSNNGQLTFMLTVSDGVATSNPDVVNIYVGESIPEPTVPPAPSSLNTNPTNETVVLTWQATDDGGSPIIDYVVEYQSENDNIWNVYNDGTTSNTMSMISGLENNVLYQFRVSAVNSVGTSTVSSLISATPIAVETIEETPVDNTPITEIPTVDPEPTVEIPVPEPTLGIASFVDESKDPQSYVNRYFNEPTYKEWFDENYSHYSSIYQAVGLEKPSSIEYTSEPISEPITEPEPVMDDEIVFEETIVDERSVQQQSISENSRCPVGEEWIESAEICMIPEPVMDVEPVSESTSSENIFCGAGTHAVNGICVLDSSTSNESGGGCLIATAAYGSEMATEVQQLRELRDNTLLQTTSGTVFMNTFNDVYYSFSPIIADYERENPMFKEVVKMTITPMIASLSLMENAESESEVISLGLSVIALNLGMYLGIPAIVVIGIRKKL